MDTADQLQRAVELLSAIDDAIRCTHLDMGGAHDYHLSVVRARKVVPLIKEFVGDYYSDRCAHGRLVKGLRYRGLPVVAECSECRQEIEAATGRSWESLVSELGA